VSKALFDRNAAMMIIAGLIKNPELVHDQDNFKLTTNDFDNEFYKIVFGAIANIAAEGSGTISAQDIDLYIGQFNKQYETFKAAGGYEFLKGLQPFIDSMDSSRFNFYYQRLKKFTVLRDLQKAGIETKEFYNPEVDFMYLDKESEKLNNITVDDIVKTILKKVNKVEDSFVSRAVTTNQKAASGIEKLYQELKQNPEIGKPLEGDILNYIVRGARFGKMYINSAPSGHGKTRFMVGNACAISLPRIEGDKVIVREDLSPVLFVTTEQGADEIQTLILAYVSGVNERKILHGDADFEEEKRILQAIELIKKYENNFIIEVIPDPSIALIRAKLTKHIFQNNVQFIFYDYIFTSPSLLVEYQQSKIREDVALMMLSNTLKEIAAQYGVFVQSATQLNERWEQTMVRNVNHIRGSKAIADKADVGMITVKLAEIPEEREIVEQLCKHAGIEIPNVVTDIYKNRRGELTGVKLFRYFDYGTCRIRDLFLTGLNHNILKNYDKIEYETTELDLLDIMTTKNKVEDEGEDNGEID
jgi:replicative DNA helicase